MLKAFRDRFTFANVMSCIAVFVALGGAAYAGIDRDSSDRVVQRAPALKGWKVVTAASGSSEFTGNGEIEVPCPGEKVVVGGGVKQIGGGDIVIRASAPEKRRTQNGRYSAWRVSASTVGDISNTTFGLRAYAICVKR